ncbi:MAG: hypothetical protein V1912_12765 [bacterium]
MRDDEAPPPWERKLDDITVDLVIAELISTGKPDGRWSPSGGA